VRNTVRAASERESLENAFEHRSEKGRNRRSLSSEESKRKEPFSQIAGRSLHTKELETQFNEGDEKHRRALENLERISFLPSFPLPTI
jgi:hypothetical protein